MSDIELRRRERSLQAPFHEAGEVRRNAGSRLLERRRILLQHRGDGLHAGGALESPVAGEHLVEDRAEREDVAARVDRQPERLLGREVGRRPHHHALGGEEVLRGERRGRLVGALGRDETGETEVQQLRASRRDDHVRGLEVAMHDALRVSAGQRLRHLGAEADGLSRRERTGGEEIGERPAFDVLHDEVVDLALTAHVVDRADVGVAQARENARLPGEPLGVAPQSARSPPGSP